MNTKNTLLMKMARESLQGKWGIAMIPGLIFFVISLVLGFIPFIGQIASFLVAGPLALGIAMFFLSIARGQETKTEQMFHGFNDFGRAFLTYILMVIFIILWSLLLIIPGVIAALSYAMTFYILADNPSIGANEAIDKSKVMMKGYKLKLLGLSLLFFLLGILCILTLGIGFLWLYPYAQVTMAKFYEDIKNNSKEIKEVKVEPVQEIKEDVKVESVTEDPKQVA